MIEGEHSRIMSAGIAEKLLARIVGSRAELLDDVIAGAAGSVNEEQERPILGGQHRLVQLLSSIVPLTQRPSGLSIDSRIDLAIELEQVLSDLIDAQRLGLVDEQNLL